MGTFFFNLRNSNGVEYCSLSVLLRFTVVVFSNETNKMGLFIEKTADNGIDMINIKSLSNLQKNFESSMRTNRSGESPQIQSISIVDIIIILGQSSVDRS